MSIIKNPFTKKITFTFESIADQIQKSVPAGCYIVLVVPPQNLNSDQMTEKILDSLPTGTEVFKIMG